MRKPSHSVLAKVGGFSALLMSGLVACGNAQPAPATVTPQPTERIRKPGEKRGANARKKAARQPKADPLVQNFEALFGRKLTDEETKKIQDATDVRTKALKEAHDNWTKEFLQITGVTETQLQQKQRELRKNRQAGAKGAGGRGAFGDAPAAPATAAPVAPAAAPVADPAAPAQ